MHQRQGHQLLCPLDQIDILITDDGIGAQSRRMLEEADIEVIVAPALRSVSVA
jgi:DeoR family ulaG and ulaABCDEF operon transcriptional repressor